MFINDVSTFMQHEPVFLESPDDFDVHEPTTICNVNEKIWFSCLKKVLILVKQRIKMCCSV